MEIGEWVDEELCPKSFVLVRAHLDWAKAKLSFAEILTSFIKVSLSLSLSLIVNAPLMSIGKWIICYNFVQFRPNENGTD